MRLRLHATGSASAAEAWRQYVHPALWKDWSPQIRRVDCVDERIRAGSTGRVHGAGGVQANFTVTSVDDERRRWSWRVGGPLGVQLGLRHAVQEVPEGCRTELEVDGFAPVVLGYAPLALLALRRLVRPARR